MEQFSYHSISGFDCKPFRFGAVTAFIGRTLILNPFLLMFFVKMTYSWRVPVTPFCDFHIIYAIAFDSSCEEMFSSDDRKSRNGPIFVLQHNWEQNFKNFKNYLHSFTEIFWTSVCYNVGTWCQYQRLRHFNDCRFRNVKCPLTTVQWGMFLFRILEFILLHFSLSKMVEWLPSFAHTITSSWTKQC